MKVMIITNEPNNKGREEAIKEIIDDFGRDGGFEFYAYGARDYDIKIDKVTVIPTWEKYTLEAGILFSRYIGDTGRMLLVFEDGIIPPDVNKMIDYHINGQYGITLSFCKKGGEYYACGVYVVEREYLDLADGNISFERDICIRCGENGELGIFYD